MKVVRIILFVINVIIALLFVATTFAGQVAPSGSILPSLLAFLYLPMLLLNVVVALLWMFFRRWEFLLSVSAIAARFSFISLFFQIGGTSTPPQRDDVHARMIVVLNHNVHQFRGDSDSVMAPSDSNAVLFLDMVRGNNPDVLCLQEFAIPRNVAVVDSLEVMGYNHYYGAHTSSKGKPYGTVIFSRLPFGYVKKIDEEKVMAELYSEGLRFRVCSVHMDSYSFDADDRQEIEKIRHGSVETPSKRTLGKVKGTIVNHEREWNNKLRSVVAECSVPLILSGDFNDIASSWLYSRISEHLDDTYVAKGSGMSTTYNGGFPKFRIDMIFCSNDWQTLSYKRIKTKLSDHNAIVAAVEIPQI